MPLGRPLANPVTSCPSCPSWIRRSLTCSICPIRVLGWTKDLPCSVTPPRSEDPCTSPRSTARLSASGTRPTPQINSISATQISTFSRPPLSSRTAEPTYAGSQDNKIHDGSPKQCKRCTPPAASPPRRIPGTPVRHRSTRPGARSAFTQHMHPSISSASHGPGRVDGAVPCEPLRGLFDTGRWI